jgi:methionyl-tRNA formyltransferase
MRVVIVTGKEPHHRHLCAVTTQAHNVVGIIHPAEPAAGPRLKARRLVQEAGRLGWPVLILHFLGKALRGHRGDGPGPEGGAAAQASFSESLAAYERIPASLIHSGCHIRDAGSDALLRSLEPDVTICLGGPVYPKRFIEASPLMLNFHSGISPIYNGARSIHFAFANGHPHLCGGTLMLMEPEIDGGRILGHYLPEVQSGDTPDSLFAKTVRGAASMYARVLDHLKTHGAALQSVPQPPPLFYTRGAQFGWYHQAATVRNLRADLAARHQRPETVLEYWREPSGTDAAKALRCMLEQLLWKDGAQPRP